MTDYLNAQIDRIEDGDRELRRGRDPIHDTRVAIRRLRSVLRVFAKVLDPSEIADMDDELKWFAGMLGDVRDCQVQESRFSEALDGVPDELILGPVESRIRNEMRAIELPARKRVDEAMDSARYQALMATLRRWRAEPPVAGVVETGTLLRSARRARRKADRRLAAALESGDTRDSVDDSVDSVDTDMLHRARKAAKRARYAGELCSPLGKAKRANRTIKHYKHIQTLLGDHQDTAVAADALRRMGLAAGTTVGENGFTYGMLYAREQQIARQCRQEVRELV